MGKYGSALIANGAVLFVIGLVAGIPFNFAAMAVDPAYPPDSLAFMPAGTENGWRVAHLEGLMNGILLFAAGGWGERVRLTERMSAVLFWLLLAMTWLNVVGSFLAPALGVRGLAPLGGAETLINVMFTLVAVSAFVAMGLIIRGALAARRKSGA